MSRTLARPSHHSANPSSHRSAHHRLLQRATLAALCAVSAGAWADPSPALDRMSVSVGGFYADPSIQIDGDTRYGHVDTGNTDGDRTTVPRIKASMLIGDSQGLDFDYYRYDKDYSPSFSGSTNVGGQPVSGTAKLDGNLKLDLAQLAYKWWIGSGNDVFGIGLGAAYYHAELGGTATAVVSQLSGDTTGSASASVSDHTFAPLVELGWRHAFSHDVRMYAEASGIKKNGGNTNGHIYGGSVGVEWFPFKNVGFVADYGISKISLNHDSSNANYNIKLKGPSAFLKARF